MLWLNNEIIGRHVSALDGEKGKIKDIYFDDQSWIIRYFVVDAGSWFLERDVLISPACVAEPDVTENVIPIQLTRETIEHSPDSGAKLPVNRQKEASLVKYYGWPVYWSTSPLTGTTYPTTAILTEPKAQAPLGREVNEKQANNDQETESQDQPDPHLRSAKEVCGYHVEALTDSIGHVEDLIYSPKDWLIRYLVIDTVNWLPGKKVLISPKWVETFDWSESKVFVKLPAEVIREAPEFTPEEGVTLSYEQVLHTYYGRMGYWNM